MRKRNCTVTIRMNKENTIKFQSKLRNLEEHSRKFVIKAIADLKVALQRKGRTEKIEPGCLQIFSVSFGELLQILIRLQESWHTDGEVPNDSTLYFLNKNILKYRRRVKEIWLNKTIISGQIHEQ